MMLRYRDGHDLQHMIYWADTQKWFTYCGEPVYNNEVIGLLTDGAPTCVRCIGMQGQERSHTL